MSRTAVLAATVLALAMAVPSLAQAQAQAQHQAQAQARPTPVRADAATRAAYDRADALSRSVFWAEQQRLDPMDPEAGVKLSRALRELGRYDQAAEAAQATLMVQPDNIEAMLELGRAHWARGQAFYGIAALERARDLAPNDWRPWSLLGASYEQVRRHDDARAAWDQALRLSPDNPAVLSNLAMTHLAAGDLATAETLLRRAADQPGAGLQVRLNLAMTLGLKGEMGEAERILRRELPPEQADQNLAWLRAHAGGPAPAPGRTWDSLQ